MLGKRSQAQKVTYTKCPKQANLHKGVKQICGCQGLGEGNEEQVPTGPGFPLSGGEQVLEPESGDGCTTL